MSDLFWKYEQMRIDALKADCKLEPGGYACSEGQNHTSSMVLCWGFSKQDS